MLVVLRPRMRHRALGLGAVWGVLVLLVGVSAVSLASAQAAGGGRWRLEPISAPGANGVTPILNGVACTSTRSCVAVGQQASGLLAERWRGSRWSIMSTPNPPRTTTNEQPQFLAVSCSSASACMAVGETDCGGPLAERWNGRAWSLETVPLVTKKVACTQPLNGVLCRSTRSCLAVGTSGYYQLVERWNGSRWTVMPSPRVSGGAGLMSVSCPSRRACAFVGGTADGSLLEWWDAGKWTIKRGHENDFRTSVSFNAVSCSSRDDCVAVGGDTSDGDYPVAAQWNGVRWLDRTPTVGDGQPLTGVGCDSEGACTAVGQDAGQVLRWDGIRWLVQRTHISQNDSFAGVSCVSDAACTAVGGGNTYLVAHPSLLAARDF